MNTQANYNSATPQVLVAAAVGKVLEDRDARAKAAAEEKAASELLERLKASKAELDAKVTELNSALETKNEAIKTLEETVNHFNQTVDQLVSGDDALLVASSEILALKGCEAFDAKIGWIKQTVSSLKSRSTRADELEADLAKAALVIREKDIREMFRGLASEETINALVEKGKSLADEDYEEWRDEKEILSLELKKKSSDAVSHKKMPHDEMMDEEDEEDKKKEAKKEKASNLFAALLERERAELINHPGDPSKEVKSGVDSSQLKNPKFKIGGSAAGNDPAKVLENVEPENSINLAGASQSGEEKSVVNGFRALALEITGYSDDSESKEDSDPVK